MPLMLNEENQWVDDANASKVLSHVAAYAYPAAKRSEVITTSALCLGGGIGIGLLISESVKKHARKNNPGIANAIFGNDAA